MQETQTKNKLVLSTTSDLQTSNIIFTVGAGRAKPLVQKPETRKINKFWIEIVVFLPFLFQFLPFCF